ncbi:MAG: hypothetical protein KKA44_07940 [Alphaproteobacteria bacterium]|nr:hypothetical protein [Alphaproteobacteria bacterium]MBU0865114.1 hypothetical protein [Alphaproteobacteria bacterium]MBU1824891.1 hypothetical protein [Alphaproteobacteria bacterium]
MEVIDRKHRGLEIWDVDDVAPAVRDEATAAALAVLDLEGVSPLEARVAQFTLEGMDDKGVLGRADPSDFGLNMAQLNACREAEAAARRVIDRLAPNRAEPYLMLGVAEWALDEWQAHDTDPTKI